MACSFCEYHLSYPRRFAAAPRGNWGKTPKPPPIDLYLRR